MTEAARLARSRNLKIKKITHLDSHVRGYQLLHRRKDEKVQELRMALAYRCTQFNPLDMTANKIETDLLHTRQIKPTRCRYSIESLVWS
jgi:hypothetical protein